MYDFTSTHMSQRRGVRATTTLLISTGIAEPILTAPIRLRFLQMHTDGKSANANVIIYALYILHNSIVVLQDMKTYTSK